MALTAPLPIPASHKWNKIPEILYEAPRYPGAKTDPIPYIEVPKELHMPPVLFIVEHKHTGETEVGLGGQPEEVTEDTPHRFVDLEFLLDRLEGPSGFTPEQITQVYFALGMQSRAESRRLGEQALERVLGQASELKQAAESTQDSRIEAIQAIMEQAKERMRQAQQQQSAAAKKGPKSPKKSGKKS